MLRIVERGCFRHRDERVGNDNIPELLHLVRHGNRAAAKARAQLVVVRADRDKLEQITVHALRVHGARSRVTVRYAAWRRGTCSCETVYILITNYYDVRKRGEYPTRCHGSVSIWPPGSGGFANDVNTGKVLNKNIFEPRPSVIFSNNRIIDCMRVFALVMIGTKKFGKPKCVR